MTAAVERPGFLKAKRTFSGVLAFRTKRKNKTTTLASIMELEEPEEIQTPGLAVLQDIYNTSEMQSHTVQKATHSQSYSNKQTTPTVEFMSLTFTEDPTAASLPFEETPLYTPSHFDSVRPINFGSISMGEGSIEDLEPNWARSERDWPTTLSDNFTVQPKLSSLGKRRRDSEVDEDRVNAKRQRTIPIDTRPRRRSARIANASVVHSKVASIPPPPAPQRKRRFEDVEQSADEISDDILRHTKRRITGP
ncbi:hypothetical protein C8F04DRAFT_1123720 [Mycena alexandri]|uniref:Uncharacterized protein n=1 Tax=Mycena alexandri TaxID=1745969 RepID=A0AAD6SG70_9AGAR|nr:hypothetical protein C8F04DRAFT_1123720 [Mycena alexandri]